MIRLNRSLVGLVALCSITANAHVTCDYSEDAAEALEALEQLQVEVPSLDFDRAIGNVRILLDDECDTRRDVAAEAELEDFAWELLDDSGQEASLCGTQAQQEYQQCQNACAAAGKVFCGCVMAFFTNLKNCD